jgi:hypothetical protein
MRKFFAYLSYLLKPFIYLSYLLEYGSYRGKWEYQHRAEPDNRAKWRRMQRELYHA